MTPAGGAPPVVLLDLGGGDEGHRSQYVDFLGGLFPLERHEFSAAAVFARGPVLVPLIEDSLARYALTAALRSLMGRRTAGFLFRPRPALGGTALRHRIKRAALRLLRRLPGVTTLTILPFSVEPRLAEIADDWIYDPQLWDLTAAERQAAAGASGPLAAQIRSIAAGRPVCCAIGRQDHAKGFDRFAAVWAGSPELRKAQLFAFGGKVAEDVQDDAARFAEAGGFGAPRMLSDAELLDLYAAADLVWCVYAPEYDQASGILGRAMQLGIPVAVRAGSLIETLCRVEGHPFVAVSGDDPEPLLKLPGRADAAACAARARAHGTESRRRLGAALGLDLALTGGSGQLAPTEARR